MEPVLFYGVPQGCSFGSIVALEWLGQPYRLCRINMPEDMQGELYARINPVRETPALLLENGTTLSESAAILQHLAARGLQRGLGFPQGTPEHDRLNQVLSFLNTSFFSAFSPLWTAFEMAEDPPVQAMLRTLGREQVAKAHAHLEAMLAAGSGWPAARERSPTHTSSALRAGRHTTAPSINGTIPTFTGTCRSSSPTRPSSSPTLSRPDSRQRPPEDSAATSRWRSCRRGWPHSELVLAFGGPAAGTNRPAGAWAGLTLRAAAPASWRSGFL